MGHSEACHFPKYSDSSRRGVTLMLLIDVVSAMVKFIAGIFMAEGQNWV